MLLKIHPENPSIRNLQQAAEVLKAGGIIIFPTDTVYAIGCDASNQKAYERLCRIRQVKPEKSTFSFLLKDLSHLSEYTRPFERNVFKILKASLPGPFTFIMNAGTNVPALYRNRRKTIGIRVPDHAILASLISLNQGPLVSASLHDSEDEIAEYLTDPEIIHERYEKIVDLVIDGGPGKNVPSTVIDCTGDEPVVVRQGLGEVL